MIKKNKWKMLISSLVILLPIIAGLLLWDTLPDKIATHWGIGGEANGWSSRAFAVFGMPALLLVIHWVCMLATAADPKNKEQNKKPFRLVFWICPIVSLYSSAIIYAAVLGMNFSTDVVTMIFIGLMFAVIGNYLPKCKQNFTVGIKLPWTLSDEENWNKTHRLGGRIWVIGGLLMMVGAFLPPHLIPFVLSASLLVIAIIPVIYSYLLYRKNKQ